jgi:NADPH:quinone reductase-like Zn-dependent oxidoreductase
MALLGSDARSRRSIAAMMHMVHRGGIRGVVDRMFELAQAGRAHEVTAGRDFFGKLVMRVP